jgi:hypothetical protein
LLIGADFFAGSSLTRAQLLHFGSVSFTGCWVEIPLGEEISFEGGGRACRFDVAC